MTRSLLGVRQDAPETQVVSTWTVCTSTAPQVSVFGCLSEAGGSVEETGGVALEEVCL